MAPVACDDIGITLNVNDAEHTIVVGRGSIGFHAGAAPVITVTPPTGLRVGYPVDVVVASSSCFSMNFPWSWPTW